MLSLRWFEVGFTLHTHYISMRKAPWMFVLAYHLDLCLTHFSDSAIVSTQIWREGLKMFCTEMKAVNDTTCQSSWSSHLFITVLSFKMVITLNNSNFKRVVCISTYLLNSINFPFYFPLCTFLFITHSLLLTYFFF